MSKRTKNPGIYIGDVVLKEQNGLTVTTLHRFNEDCVTVNVTKDKIKIINGDDIDITPLYSKEQLETYTKKYGK